jgi:hypothetical protein
MELSPATRGGQLKETRTVRGELALRWYVRTAHAAPTAQNSALLFAASPLFVRHLNRVAAPMLRLCLECPVIHVQVAGVPGGELVDGHNEGPAPFLGRGYWSAVFGSHSRKYPAIVAKRPFVRVAISLDLRQATCAPRSVRSQPLTSDSW